MREILLNTAKWVRNRILKPYTLNNAQYWDRYVLLWNLSGKYDHLGDEWKNEEVFLKLLQKYAAGRSTALEIGCGGGKITAKAAGLFEKIHATDVSRRMLQLSQKALEKNAKVQFQQIDGFTLKEFADKSIDLVYSHDVFVHFSSLQVYPYLCEIKRVLKPKGVMIISFYNFVQHFELFKEMAREYYNDRRFPPPYACTFRHRGDDIEYAQGFEFTSSRNQQREFFDHSG
jgi:ubiquinone/menaquinone biosynthesis C-methylase UbiE